MFDLVSVFAVPFMEGALAECLEVASLSGAGGGKKGEPPLKKPKADNTPMKVKNIRFCKYLGCDPWHQDPVGQETKASPLVAFTSPLYRHACCGGRLSLCLASLGHNSCFDILCWLVCIAK